jgi:hypothetical protein
MTFSQLKVCQTEIHVSVSRIYDNQDVMRMMTKFSFVITKIKHINVKRTFW